MAKAHNKKRLTDQMIERLSAPKQRRIEIGDDLCPGLLIRVTERGVKSFSVIYRIQGEGGVSATGRVLKGKQRRITLGQWPILSLKDARAKARDVLADASEGIDTRQKLQESLRHRSSNSVDSVIDRFVRLHAQRNIKSWKNVERFFELHIKPAWNGRSIMDISRSDIHILLDNLTAEGKVGTAREARKHLSTLFNWALDREIVTNNPAYKINRQDLQNNFDAGRALSDEELCAVWLATDELDYPFGPWFKLLILTGQRRNEWARAQEAELNLESKWLEIPRSRYKGKRDHIIPLSSWAIRIANSLPSWSGNNPYLFSTTGGKRPISGFSRAKQRLDKLAQQKLQQITGDDAVKFPPYRVHDFRVTCETRLANLGYNQEIRDAVLGHAQSGLQRTYNKHDYLEEKRHALRHYSVHIWQTVRRGK